MFRYNKVENQFLLMQSWAFLQN